jgi:hypothetical protein
MLTVPLTTVLQNRQVFLPDPVYKLVASFGALMSPFFCLELNYLNFYNHLLCNILHLPSAPGQSCV